MTISLGNALKSVKEDEKWISKIGIGSIISILVIISSTMMEHPKAATNIIIAGFALYFIFGGILSGFLISTGNLRLNSDSKAMSEWNEPNLLLKGLKFLFSYIVYAFVLMILFTLIATVLTIAASIVLGAIYYLVNLALNLPQQAVGFAFGIVFTILITVLTLYLMQFMSASLVCYYKNFKFHDLMAFKKQLVIIFKNQHASWTLVGKIILYALLFMLVTLIAIITIVGILAIPIIYFAAHIVITDLYVQYGKEVEINKYIE